MSLHSLCNNLFWKNQTKVIFKSSEIPATKAQGITEWLYAEKKLDQKTARAAKLRLPAVSRERRQIYLFNIFSLRVVKHP